MKWMRAVAAMSVTVALAFGAAGCAKKEEAKPASGAASNAASKGLSDKFKDAAPPAK